MTAAPQAHEILPGVLEWGAYSAEHKVELTSHAVHSKDGWWVFDPIPLVESDLWFPRGTAVVGIVLTNANHERDAAAWARRCGAPLWAAADLTAETEICRRCPPEVFTRAGWSPVPLPGGAPGETAWHLPQRSLLVMGDAVVNLPGRNLEVLPDRYCTDPHQLRRSLRGLPDADNAVFAHGRPLLGQATRRILELVGGPDGRTADPGHIHQQD